MISRFSGVSGGKVISPRGVGMGEVMRTAQHLPRAEALSVSIFVISVTSGAAVSAMTRTGSERRSTAMQSAYDIATSGTEIWKEDMDGRRL